MNKTAHPLTPKESVRVPLTHEEKEMLKAASKANGPIPAGTLARIFIVRELALWRASGKTLVDVVSTLPHETED